MSFIMSTSTVQRTLSLFFFQAEDGIRDATVTGVQTCALPICSRRAACCSQPSACRRMPRRSARISLSTVAGPGGLHQLSGQRPLDGPGGRRAPSPWPGRLHSWPCGAPVLPACDRPEPSHPGPFGREVRSSPRGKVQCPSLRGDWVSLRRTNRVPLGGSGQFAASARASIAGRPETISIQVPPLSVERKTEPEAVPKADISSAATRQCVLTLSSNQSGRPWLHFSKRPSPAKGRRYTALCFPRGPVEAETSTVLPLTATAREYEA